VCDCDAAADGLDSAGCSPKDDEDDDSDDEAPENCGAAALKSNKISPASGYHAGSSYYFPMAKEKSWLARCGDRQHLSASENNSSCLDPSDNSFCSHYQLRRSDDSTPAGRGFSPSSDVVMERMMRRKEARRQRESANMTTADSVAGYRGKDCSIEELMEYIDAKPPTVPKTGQRRTGNRKSRKKKRSSNRSTKSDNGDVKSAMPVSDSLKHGDTSSNKTSPEKLAAKHVSTADDGTDAANEHETRLSLGDDKVDSESMSELPLRCDTLFQMLPSDGSSNNTSDADNVLDSRTDSSFRNHAQFSEHYRELVDMASAGAGSQAGSVDDSLSVKLDTEEPMSEIHVLDTQSTETATCAKVDELGTVVVSSSCLKPYDSTVSNKETMLNCEHCEEIKISQTDTNSPENEIIAPDSENCSPAVSSSFIGVSADVVVDSVNGICAIQRRHSEGLGCTTVHREIAGQTSESAGRVWKVCSTDTGQSTPSSSVSDARDSLDFDSQSLADDVSSDFDFSVPASRESDFTVVTQKKKKKKQTSQNSGSAGCLRRTFYNRNHLDGHAVHDWQSRCRNESVFRESGIMPCAVTVTCSSASNNLQLHSLPVSQQTGTCLEVSTSAEVVESLVRDKRTGSDTNNVSYTNHNVSNSVLDHTTGTSTHGENISQFSTGLSSLYSHKSMRTAKDVTRLSTECKTQEKVFLDTRRPNMGTAPAPAFSELSFWYDVNIPENQSKSVQTDTHTLASSYNVGEPGENAEVSRTNNSANFASCSTDPVVNRSASSVTCAANVNTRFYYDSCTNPAVSLQSSADDSSFSVVNVSQLSIHDIPLVDNCSQTCIQPLLTQAPARYVTATSDVSSSSHNNPDNSTHSGSLVIRPVVSSTLSQSPAVISASATDSVRHSSGRSRQRFDLQDAQLFLYSG